ncbi:N-acetylglutaminylglutamine synthetase [Botrimarina sp.]|uniref:N-acetylglutaminylglutamine synthetase n=1 Tax=Botrimarina sp. TaxID=2795802 RepID=UPI0032ED0F06
MAEPTPLPEQASVISVGWGRLLFAHTFPDASSVARALLDEKRDQRDIAFYVTDPQLILAEAPQDLFLDPSTTFRLPLATFEPGPAKNPIRVTPIASREELDEVNRIYAAQGMVPLDADDVWRQRGDPRFAYCVARPTGSERILGVALEVDHQRCFDDLLNSSSLWALAVDPQSELPGVGWAIVTAIAERMKSRGRDLLDLSVMQDNDAAIALYEQMGFERVPVLAIKRRNQINEPLFVPTDPTEGYNVYATIIIKEALRRGIAVEPVDRRRGFFRLVHASRRVTCHESLSDLTSAIAFCRCSDKSLTRDVLAEAGLAVPEQLALPPDSGGEPARAFLREHRAVVVKPAVGEQGAGVTVDVRDEAALADAILTARRHDDTVLLERLVEGEDVRVVVINFQVVAAAVRKPPRVSGTGRHTARDLIERLSRRRSAATEGESVIPIDAETERCLRAAGYGLDDVVPAGESVAVRKTANLHTGGTIEDVTPLLSEALRDASQRAARALEIPVVGLDLITPDVGGDRYAVIEANERPGLANHEPQPTAERFIDLLFPHTLSPTPQRRPTAGDPT